MNERLTTTAAMLILTVWTLTTVDGMLTGDYEALQIVTPIMVILAGYLFARDFINPGRRRRKEEE